MRTMVLIAAMAVLAVPAMPALAGDAVPKFTPAAGEYSPPKPKKGFKYPDCFCTDSNGKRVEMGATACLKIGSQKVFAKCDMSLNNPTWRHLEEGCPDATS